MRNAHRKAAGRGDVSLGWEHNLVVERQQPADKYVSHDYLDFLILTVRNKVGNEGAACMELRWQKFSIQKIADQLHLSCSTVRRRLAEAAAVISIYLRSEDWPGADK